MNTGDLLDELRNNILNDRGTSTGDSDKLWSDTTLIRYLNEAQRRFARRSWVIRDARSPEVANVTLKEGVTEYDLHPAIISIISAKIEGARTDLIRVGHTLLDSYNTVAGGRIDPSSFEQLGPGQVAAYSTDESLVEDDDGSVSALTMRVFPAPSAAVAGTIIKLRTIRMPLEPLSANAKGSTPEIPADHHMDMLDWAAYLALRIVDDDAGSPKRAQDFANSFEAHVVEAKKLVLSKLYSPPRWGFGGSGWGGYDG